ncbi:MAG: TrmH family RNA methyltransferase [Candidatus Dadabacteria bacterium]
MLSKKVIKDIQSLVHKKLRDESGLFVAEGRKIVDELIKTEETRIETIYATPDWVVDYPDLPNVQVVTKAELQRISFLSTPNKVLALVKYFPVQVPNTKTLVLYLDEIQDPGNLGTIIRIADWFGINNVVCSEQCADHYNPKVVQATMGSIARVRVYSDYELQWLKKQQPVYVSTIDGTTISEFGKVNEGVLVIGNESRGIREEILDLANATVSIPRIGGAESLNAAIATGILLSHMLT